MSTPDNDPIDLWGDVKQVITKLHRHSGCVAKRLQYWAIGFAVITAVSFLVVGLAVFYVALPTSTAEATWAVARVSVWILIAAVPLFLSRILWNYSNVWLGRAGTLEDLALALNLVGVEQVGTQSNALRDIAESLERLRRGFEGDLLKGPSFEVKMPGKG